MTLNIRLISIRSLVLSDTVISIIFLFKYLYIFLFDTCVLLKLNRFVA